MRLITPAPGECYDRLTILKLKMDHSTIPEFFLEHEAIAFYMKDKHWQVPIELAYELQKINTRLWDLEDKQRAILKNINGDPLKWEVNIADEILINAVTIV